MNIEDLTESQQEEFFTLSGKFMDQGYTEEQADKAAWELMRLEENG